MNRRFLVRHLAYPWSRDLLVMAFIYRHIWLDLTWSFLLSPSHFKLALHEAIEVLPDQSRMIMGGDNFASLLRGCVATCPIGFPGHFPDQRVRITSPV